MADARLTETFSMRLSPAERYIGDQHALQLGVSLSALVRLTVFSKDFEQSYQRLVLKRDEQKELAKVLATLGQSRIASNLNQIAYAINTSQLEVTPDVTAQMIEAVETVQWIRNTLILKLKGK